MRILAIRFSAIGDVAMTVPVLDSFLRQYPQHSLTFLSNPRFEAFFTGMPANFHFLGADVKTQYKGNSGLRRLVTELRLQDFDLVLDLHGVLRSRRISIGLLLHGTRLKSIRKQRIARGAITRRHFKRSTPLTTAFERYCQVFQRAGFPVELNFKSIFKQAPTGILSFTGAKSGQWIGIAPFAAHEGKIYPLELMEKVVAQLNVRTSVSRIFVFAYGKERELVSEWLLKYDKVEITGGRYSFSEELELMYWLDVMLAMDSANMHLASITGTRVVSVWGATHPNAGFLGYGQNSADCVQTVMPCRPCSIYGKKPCRFGNCHCMTSITPEQILSRIPF